MVYTENASAGAFINMLIQNTQTCVFPPTLAWNPDLEMLPAAQYELNSEPITLLTPYAISSYGNKK